MSAVINQTLRLIALKENVASNVPGDTILDFVPGADLGKFIGAYARAEYVDGSLLGCTISIKNSAGNNSSLEAFDLGICTTAQDVMNILVDAWARSGDITVSVDEAPVVPGHFNIYVYGFPRPQ